MDNLGTHATLGIRYITKTNNVNNTTQKPKRMSNIDPNKKQGVNPDTRE